jgi:hypothetical protein
MTPPFSYAKAPTVFDGNTHASGDGLGGAT